MVVPKKVYRKPPSEDSDDDGGDPMDTDLPDLDLPPGISLPINDFEPDYNRPRRFPIKPEPIYFWSCIPDITIILNTAKAEPNDKKPF